MVILESPGVMPWRGNGSTGVVTDSAAPGHPPKLYGSEESKLRWLKHLSLAHDDAALSEILEEFGPEGYGIYWLMLEHLAAGIEKESDAVPSRIHSVVKWSQICHSSVRRFRSFAQRSNELHLINIQTTKYRLQIHSPNLLKYRDEYSKKSRQTPVQIRTDRDKNRERVDPEPEIFASPAEIRKRAVSDSLVRSLDPGNNPLTVEELETAWDRHKKHRGEQPRSLVFSMVVSRNGKFDLERFRDRHPRWCEHWDAKDWQFCSLSFWDWIEAGMPEPPQRTQTREEAQNESSSDRLIRVAEERVRRTGKL